MGRAKKESTDWIKNAIKHAGALRESLNVKKCENIPENKLEKASHSKNSTLKHRADLALTLKKFKK